MKKIILTILTTISILGLNAQGNNLQFNRALFERIASFNVVSNSLVSISNSFSVPSGKTWKITSFGGSDQTISSSGVDYIQNVSISKAGENNFYRFYMSNTNNVGNKTPIWLPEGFYDIKVQVSTSNSSNPFNLIVSGIEFNIVP